MKLDVGMRDYDLNSEKAGSLELVKVITAMDPFRSDPRYVDLLKRMGLPQ